MASLDLRSYGCINPALANEDIETLPGGAAIWAHLLAHCADPDLCAAQLARLHHSHPTLLAQATGEERRLRVVALFGGSQFLGDYIIANPQQFSALWEATPNARQTLLEAIGTRPDAPIPVAAPNATADDIRRAYRRILIGIAATDLANPQPLDNVRPTAALLADLADAALEAGLAIARRDIDPDGHIRLAIIAMGKTGARELNYISDVDVLYVVDDNSEQNGDQSTTERDIIEMGTRLAVMTAAMCSGPGNEPPLWTVDANLRPEGRNGALVRTLASYRAYWEKWAQTWEFQALLKARFAAGNRDLGQDFESAAAPYVWNAAGREGFVHDARAMRIRVEENIPRGQADRELKLGRGGLRDVEFTVQLLQLVHGRTDSSLHHRDTLGAIEALSAGGYVSRDDARELSACYCFLRAVEHRAQLTRMRRTHLAPKGENEERTMARALRLDPATPAHFTQELARIRGRVRALHEDFFYRPIVAAIAGLSPDEAALDRDAAKARLAAIGYLNPEGALHHITALTSGTSRRAAIQRHLLPVFISWLAQGADPDQGLLGFRSISERIGQSHWYLALLRDSGVAASRLCALLPNSRWLADALCEHPEAVQWLDDDDLLEEAAPARLAKEIASLISRHDGAAAASRIRSVRSREVTRAALADALVGIEAHRGAIAHAMDAALGGALAIAQREEITAHGYLRAHIGIIAMGRLGGEECSYASDADVMIVHRPGPGSNEAQAAAGATAMVNRMTALLASGASGMPVAVDMALRPEGKNGPLSRTVESYHEYHQRWASPWERQALLRARPAAGDTQVVEEFFQAMNPIRWNSEVTTADLKEIRLLKARMEKERLPRGMEPLRHVKLGPGGFTDVEWVIQLLQMRYAADYEPLRVTSTVAALNAAVECGLLEEDAAQILQQSWSLASRIRSGNVLTSGRMSGIKLDVLPRESRELIPLARILGYPPGGHGLLEEEWLRASRRSRDVMDDLFWS
ncbi:MAG: bifunctional [glutamine synthetase] adenylyltransferase/[glutamine synthetase]-adenylyl-L-tyrosine phosphorylase [Actinomycetaceae bacterium]|nr:bifunctional [glutamine synthetase] adenylyltransferase/[glutamine synthetase]-adenylyl-L-tyrosine phosphorylase [Actinomycetaceae bacterium]